MKLDNQTLALIAVGASVTANCQPCLEHNVGTALKCGADGQQIAEAVEVGKRVRHGAATKLDKFAAALNPAVPLAAGPPQDDCGCSS
jgi:AhpD family alkylhydroperoxidase